MGKECTSAGDAGDAGELVTVSGGSLQPHRWLGGQVEPALTPGRGPRWSDAEVRAFRPGAGEVVRREMEDLQRPAVTVMWSSQQ